MAALIPIGKLGMIQVNKSDRTGACGRAALHEVRVRNMCNYGLWSPAIADTDTSIGSIAIDPLGRDAGVTSSLGCVDRYTLSGVPVSIFRWSDELIFDAPVNSTLRPRIVARDSNNVVAPYPRLPTDPASVPTLVPPLTYEHEGNFSWFFTVTPSTNEATLSVSQRRTFNVSIVVCYKRALTVADQTANITKFTGGGVELSGSISDLKTDDWVMICGQKIYSDGQRPYCEWYRVVASVPSLKMLTLIGPDWDTNIANPQLVRVDGVTGVYTTTVRLN